MKLSLEMKNLSEEILASFKQRIKENEELVIDVQKTLDKFQKDHQEMASSLRSSFAKNDLARLEDDKKRLLESENQMKKIAKDNQDMAEKLRANLDQGETERMNASNAFMQKTAKDNNDTAAALRSSLDKGEKARMKASDAFMKKTAKDNQDTANALRLGLDDAERARMNDYVALMKGINEEISDIFTYTHALLETSEKDRLTEFAANMKQIHEEIVRIFTYTQNLMLNGETQRLKEYAVVMTGISNHIKNLKKSIASLLGDYAQDRGEASAAWKKMSDIIAQLRKTAVTPTMKVAKKAEKKEAPVVEAKVTLAEVQPTVETKPVSPMTLEDKVIDYVNKHPNGVKVSEMEEPLGETRMKLGFVAKNLLDEGKVQKVENVYFPLK